MRRHDVARKICDLAGESIVRMIEPANGWPSLIEVFSGNTWNPVALFAAPVGLSARNRDAVERRFQNPGGNRPMIYLASHTPMFIGLWETDFLVEVAHPVLVSADVDLRAANETRFSLFPKLSALRIASVDGWTETTTNSEECLTYFWPEFIDAAADALIQGVVLPAEPMAIAVQASGLSDDGTALDAVARVRRLARRLVRDARFSKDVLSAYGSICAMCGLGSGLVEAAHILPASASGAPDVVANGISLCRNHHGAFDRHLIWVDPFSRGIVLHPVLLLRAATDHPTAIFVAETQDVLLSPESGSEPDASMFERRYAHLSAEYDWVE